MKPKRRMRNIIRLSLITLLGCLMTASFAGCDQEQTQNFQFQVSDRAASAPDRTHDSLTRYVNPFIGSEPLLDPEFIGYTPPENWRVWAGLTFPGPALPFAAVQMSPITEFGTGSGYQYEDDFILGFAHTNLGHWNYGHIPVIPVTGQEKITRENLGSHFSKKSETAAPGYYKVLLEDYDVTVELTSTLRTGNHRFRYHSSEEKRIVFDLSRANNRVRDWQIEQVGERAVAGYQSDGSPIYFYAAFDRDIERFLAGESREDPLTFIDLESGGPDTVHMQIGLSYVSRENAEENYRSEAQGRTFDEIRQEADRTWEEVLRKVQVKGGTSAHKEQLYSGIYRAFLHPHLRSDVNGEYRDSNGEVARADFSYYSTPALWDTFRNKLVLMGTFFPEITADVISSLIDRGEKRGFLPNYFHGDSALTFITGSWLRGITGFDVEKAYEIMLRNATLQGSPRDYLDEYMERGYVIEAEFDEYPDVGTSAKASVTKTLEYSYDDFALALLAREMGDLDNYEYFMKRSGNYRNLFDSETGFMRGRVETGEFASQFDPKFPHYYYQYREANAWNGSFYVPHDTPGLVALYDSPEQFEDRLDELFNTPWNPNHIARNVCCFLGQYMQGNQPSHNIPYLYYFIDKQEKSQEVLNILLNDFYGVGDEGLALPGMDDAGEMSSWFVYNALGFYTYSPAEAHYLITVPLFNEVTLRVGDRPLKIVREGEGTKITEISLDGKLIEDYRLPDSALQEGGELIIKTETVAPSVFQR